MKRLTFFKNLFKPIKSPVGELVGDDSYQNGLTYMGEDEAQYRYSVYDFLGVYYGAPEKTFADWLEAQGVRLV